MCQDIGSLSNVMYDLIAIVLPKFGVQYSGTSQHIQQLIMMINHEMWVFMSSVKITLIMLILRV